MGALLKSKVVIAVAIIAALIGLYALLGFKVAPGFVRNKAVEYARAEYGRELTLGEIRIHPFKLQFEARDISFPDTDGERMLALRVCSSTSRCRRSASGRSISARSTSTRPTSAR